MYKKIDNLVIEDARIIFKNFEGRESKNNRKGDRNFCVVFDDFEKAQQLKADGWNIKQFKARGEDDEPGYYLPIALSFDKYPPMVSVYTRRSKTNLDEASIAELDSARIKSVDLVVNPYCWEANGRSGIKAYLREMNVVLEESVFADKYAEYDNANYDSIPF